MQPSLRYTSGAGYIVEYVAVLNLHWSVLFIFRFSDLPWACLRHALQEEKALFFQDL